MATFTAKKKHYKATPDKATHEGGAAFTAPPELDLYASVATFMDGSDGFYEKGGTKNLNKIDTNTKLGRLIADLQRVNPLFVAKLAVYARENMNMRTVPTILAVEMAKLHNPYVSKVISRVVKRPDEIVEALSYYAARNQDNWKKDAESGRVKKVRKLSSQIKKGLAIAFRQFDEYQLSKYNKTGMEITLKDAVRLLRPKPIDEKQSELFRNLANGTLQKARTHEAVVGKAVSTEGVEAKGKAWEELIREKKVGYMALLRELKHIISSNVSAEAIDIVLSYLTNPDAVRKSRQFPYRFAAAYNEIASIGPNIYKSQVLKALDEAVLHTAGSLNIDESKRIVVACDVSGSMSNRVSANSTVSRSEIGLLLGGILSKKSKYNLLYVFGNNAKSIPVSGSVNEFAKSGDRIEREHRIGHATNAHLVLEDMMKNKVATDSLYVFTDEQWWAPSRYSLSYGDAFHALWNSYRRTLNPNAKIFLIDLSGYGRTPMEIDSAKGVYKMAGWSMETLRMINQLSDGGSVIEEINKIKL